MRVHGGNFTSSRTLTGPVDRKEPKCFAERTVSHQRTVPRGAQRGAVRSVLLSAAGC